MNSLNVLFRRLNRRIFASWKLPFLSTKFNMSICGSNNYIKNWKYNESFARDASEIRLQLNAIIVLKDVEFSKEKQKAQKLLANLMKNWNNSSANALMLMPPVKRKIKVKRN